MKGASKPLQSAVRSGRPTASGAERLARRPNVGLWLLVALWLARPSLATPPPGCRPPELAISREHPLILLYGPGTGERTVRCWAHLPPDLKPYCVVTMDPPALDLEARLTGWRAMLRVVQAAGIPIALQVCGDEAEWTTPLPLIETLLREFPCIKIVQAVELRCAYYSRFAGDADLDTPTNLRYLAELLELPLVEF